MHRAQLYLYLRDEKIYTEALDWKENTIGTHGLCDILFTELQSDSVDRMSTRQGACVRECVRARACVRAHAWTYNKLIYGLINKRERK